MLVRLGIYKRVLYGLNCATYTSQSCDESVASKRLDRKYICERRFEIPSKEGEAVVSTKPFRAISKPFANTVANGIAATIIIKGISTRRAVHNKSQRMPFNLRESNS